MLQVSIAILAVIALTSYAATKATKDIWVGTIVFGVLSILLMLTVLILDGFSQVVTAINNIK
jgi:hypothetical protein